MWEVQNTTWKAPSPSHNYACQAKVRTTRPESSQHCALNVRLIRHQRNERAACVAREEKRVDSEAKAGRSFQKFLKQRLSNFGSAFLVLSF